MDEPMFAHTRMLKLGKGMGTFAYSIMINKQFPPLIVTFKVNIAIS